MATTILFGVCLLIMFSGTIRKKQVNESVKKKDEELIIKAYNWLLDGSLELYGALYAMAKVTKKSHPWQ